MIVMMGRVSAIYIISYFLEIFSICAVMVF